jgi:hypothetical protein
MIRHLRTRIPTIVVIVVVVVVVVVVVAVAVTVVVVAIHDLVLRAVIDLDLAVHEGDHHPAMTLEQGVRIHHRGGVVRHLARMIVALEGGDHHLRMCECETVMIPHLENIIDGIQDRDLCHAEMVEAVSEIAEVGKILCPHPGVTVVVELIVEDGVTIVVTAKGAEAIVRTVEGARRRL